MKKYFILIFLIIIISCVSNRNNGYSEFQLSDNMYVKDPSVTIDEQWFSIWQMLTIGDYESLSDCIDNKIGLRISDSLFISNDFDITFSCDDLKNIKRAEFDYFDVRLEQRRMISGTEIFKLYESYYKQKIDKVGYNVILVDKNRLVYNNIKHIQENFPKDSFIIDIFFDTDEKKGYLWKHFFMVVGYVDNKMILYVNNTGD